MLFFTLGLQNLGCFLHLQYISIWMSQVIGAQWPHVVSGYYTGQCSSINIMVKACKEGRKMLNNPVFLKHVASRRTQTFQPEKSHKEEGSWGKWPGSVNASRLFYNTS